MDVDPTAGLEPAPRAERRRPSTVVIRLPPAEVARAAMVLVAVLVGLWLLGRSLEVLVLMFVAILFATAIEPLVGRLRRGPFTRSTGTLVVYTLVILAFGLPAWVLVPSLVAQGAAFTTTLPDRITAFQNYADGIESPLLRQAAVSAVAQAGEALSHPVTPGGEQLVEVGATAAHTIVSFLTVFVLAFYWMVERPLLKRAVLRLVPAERAKTVNQVWLEVEEKLGGWVRGQLLVMLAVGLMAFAGFVALGVPSPILLAVLASLFEVIPVLGPFLAFAPAVLVTLAVDPSRAVAVFVYAIVVQQIEGNILVPRVMGHTVGISPLTVLLGILIGSVLYGLPGAFLAVPVAGAVQVILSHTLFREEAGLPPADAAPTAPPVVAGLAISSPAPAPARVADAPPAASTPGDAGWRERTR